MHTESQKEISGQKKNMFSMMEGCIQDCLDCFKICAHLVDHCLQKGGKHADSKHIKILNDCARVCNVAAEFMIRSSEQHVLICKPCAEICIQCAESCEKIADDDMMRECAKACRKCADSCEQMAQAKH